MEGGFHFVRGRMKRHILRATAGAPTVAPLVVWGARRGFSELGPGMKQRELGVRAVGSLKYAVERYASSVLDTARKLSDIG